LNERAFAFAARPIVISANRDISLPSRQIEQPFGDEQLYMHPRMASLKGIDDGRHDDGGKRLCTGYTNRTGKPAVMKLKVTVEIINGLFDLLGA
jgi:hypothetical protein